MERKNVRLWLRSNWRLLLTYGLQNMSIKFLLNYSYGQITIQQNWNCKRKWSFLITINAGCYQIYNGYYFAEMLHGNFVGIELTPLSPFLSFSSFCRSSFYFLSISFSAQLSDSSPPVTRAITSIWIMST